MNSSDREETSIEEPARPSVLGGFIFCLAVAALLRFGVLVSVDLRGSFGPDAPGIAAAALHPLSHPYPLHPLLVAALAPLFGGNPAQAALMLSLMSGLSAVAACWLMGRIVMGEHGGRAVGTLVATLPLAVYVSLLGGGDALAVSIAWWGVAFAWAGGAALSRVRGTALPAILIVFGFWLVGVSAWAKPIALPAAASLLAVPFLGGRRTLPFLLAGLLLCVATALPRLDPLLDPLPASGLLGCWWGAGAPPRDLSELFALIHGGWRALWALERQSAWLMGTPLLLLSAFGALGVGGRRGMRLVLWLAGFGGLVLVAGILGDRLQPRYLLSALLPWLMLCAWTLVPRRFRSEDFGQLVERFRPLVILDTLPLSLVMTLFVISTARLWEGLSRVRATEEGTAAPRALLSGWASEFLPVQEHAQNSICGAVELERLGRDLTEALPEGALVVMPSLRDGRSWHLRAVLSLNRPDLQFVDLNASCCSAKLGECAARLPALMSSSGGLLISPLADSESCQAGSVPQHLEGLVQSLDPWLDQRYRWFGALKVEREPGRPLRDLCVELGGSAPLEPASL